MVRRRQDQQHFSRERKDPEGGRKEESFLMGMTKWSYHSLNGPVQEDQRAWQGDKSGPSSGHACSSLLSAQCGCFHSPSLTPVTAIRNQLGDQKGFLVITQTLESEFSPPHPLPTLVSSPSFSSPPSVLFFFFQNPGFYRDNGHQNV